MNTELEDLRIGPSGYPGEYNFMALITGDDYLSYLSGLYSVDTSTIDWTKLPKLYKQISVEDESKTWLPSYVASVGKGSVYAVVGESGEWYWEAMPVIVNDKGEQIPDVKKMKLFKNIEFLDALTYIGIIDEVIPSLQ